MIKFILFAILFIGVLSIPNQRPIIGVYTQVNEDDPPREGNDIFQTFITASYIKFIEMSGAQVVPIFAYSNQSYFAQLLPKLNGVLFPGGDLEFDMKDAWTANAMYIFQYAMQQNDKGNIFPIWGTCMGHELLGFLSNGGVNPLTPIKGQQSVLNTIKFASNDRGYMLSNLPETVVSRLTTGKGITYYNHWEGISLETYQSNKKLSDFWKLLATTTSSNNDTFVAAWQARKYPFYSVQFHPQKSMFEWKIWSDKSYESVQFAQIISNRFVDKARQSTHKYPTDEQFQKTNIYNYKTYSSVMRFTRIYLFNETKPAEYHSSHIIQENPQLMRED